MSKPKLKQWKLSQEARQVVSYWRDSIVDSQRAEVSNGRSNGIECAASDMVRGHVSPTVFLDIERKADSERQQRNKGRGEAGRRGDEIPVLLSPLSFHRTSESSTGPRIVELLWVPAVLKPSGHLTPPTRGEPWIPRSLLEPQISDDRPAIGEDTELSKFSAAHGRRRWGSWSEYWSHAEALFTAVTGEPSAEYQLNGFSRRRNGSIARDEGGNAGVLPLRELYERVLEGTQNPGIIPALARRNPPKATPFFERRGWISQMAFKHCGQFGNGFPLAPSQRRAVHQALNLKEGEYLPVTGPPGTGKTTMLQSIIASYWVQAARDENSYPPIIVATGATNQAVTNVIAAMERSGQGETILSKRWLPQVGSYGTFCVSATKAQNSEEIAQYQIELIRGQSFSRSLEELEYRSRAERYYLEQFKSYSGKSLNLRAAVRYLAKQIQRQRTVLYRDILASRDGSLLEWLQSLVGLKPTKPTAQFFAELEGFDQSVRYQLFLLAGRFWEGRWLLEMQRLGNKYRSRRGDNDDDRLPTSAADWRRRAMITPAFVSTLSMLPRFFYDRRAREKPAIDLLIFDESSQITPEIGAACLGLASRALVVGDDQQLEPMWVVPSNVDLSNAAEYGLVGKDEERGHAELDRQGLLASSGSLMRLALRCAKFNDGASTIGVFLSEQRRCVPELVAVCNALAYRGRLQAFRPALDSRILPAMGYLQVEGKTDRVGTSRRNRHECEAIADWIVTNRPAILQHYGASSLEEILGVITPFAAQSDYLRNIITKRVNDDLLVGTVNSLQGAERPVIIFSTVYDPTYKEEYFFDRGTNMLNVAVSRARDSFLVFGDMRIFQNRRGKPSGILSRFLFAESENELTIPPDNNLPQQAPGEEHRWIVTLQGHIEALNNAIHEARVELFIVSPTISSAAILADRIPAQIQDAVRRGVSVKIYTDCDLDLDETALRARSSEGRKLLLEAGAELFVVQGIHSKAIGVDNQVFIDGSFNWLSANRRLGSRHQKLESSNFFRGKEAAKRITLLKQEMEYRGFVDQSGLLSGS